MRKYQIAFPFDFDDGQGRVQEIEADGVGYSNEDNPAAIVLYVTEQESARIGDGASATVIRERPVFIAPISSIIWCKDLGEITDKAAVASDTADHGQVAPIDHPV